MFINVATIDGIKAEVFHRRNHSTSSFNFYYKFNFTGIIQKSHFSIEMKISYTLFLTVMVAIKMERCRAEYLLVAVEDDVVREPQNDDVGNDVVREPNNDDEIRRKEIEELRRNDICETTCCCDSCYPCDNERLAELRKIAEERKAAEQQKAVETSKIYKN